jgi:hypothetical protein
MTALGPPVLHPTEQTPLGGDPGWRRSLRSEQIEAKSDDSRGYLGVTLVLWVDTHCHRPSRMTQTSV